MVQPYRRARNPLSTATAAILLLVAVIGAFWVPFYARSAPKLGDFPFFYWFLLIWMPVVMVLCYLAYLLMRTTPASTGGQEDGTPARDGQEAK
jgi:amino acid permease